MQQQNDGAKSVQVGTRIAVLADAGDDISGLDIPSEDTAKASTPKAKEEEPAPSSSEAKETPAPTNDSRETSNDAPTKKSSSPPPSGPGQNKAYPLYPSVAQLLHENHISPEDISKIPASGPQGRLLKGDVLAYLGQIASDYSSKQSARIKNMQHLDLSNIKIASPSATTPGNVPAPPTPSSTLPPLPTTTSVAISISLSQVLSVQKHIQDTLGVSIPLSTFLARATDLANDDLPRSRTAPPNTSELFDAVLGLGAVSRTTRGNFSPQITALPPASLSSRPSIAERRPIRRPDIIDVLTGVTAPKSRSTGKRVAATVPGISAGKAEGAAMNVFSVEVPIGDEKRARTFLERVKTVLQVEPGQLVL